MKTWNEPMIEELNINETAGGSWTITSHDGNIVYTQDPTNPDRQIPSEQWQKPSGQ